MVEVAVVGAGQTPYGDFPDLTIKEMFAAAVREAAGSVDKGFDPGRVGAAYIGTLGSGGFQLGQSDVLVAEYAGLPAVPVTRVENACASGGFALYTGALAIMSGLYDVVVAGGVEKMRDVSATKNKYWLGVSGDTEYERLAGVTFSGIYAIMARRYMFEHGVDRKYLSMVAVKNHKHGAMNPKAHIRREITLEEAMSGAPVAAPLNVYDCCPTSDGAAAVILARGDIAREFTVSPVFIKGMGAGADALAIHDRPDITGLQAVRDAARQAYAAAGVGPDDIDLAEVHDCFTIAEIMAYEDLGFAPRGQAGDLLDRGDTSIGGSIPMNVSGGLKSKGHPLGATGVGQVCEVFHQLRGTAESAGRQVKNARLGLTHNVGGSGGTATVFILERR
ncbi:MAG: thiolase domain-containing protein [Firmicutes bacterium]|nr:thiolase domain-containing protein [Bacillota bacterium]